MAIPSSQLETWSHQGATATAQATHTSVRNALSSYQWPDSVRYDDYLQGSYRNSTNIRGDSDVDLVVELTSVFWSNLSQDEKQQLGITPASYTLREFRLEVIEALTSYYRSHLIDTSGSKSVKVLPSSGRLHADVVVCGGYRYYSNLRLIASGITFWSNPDNLQIINYPKLHYANGIDKNSQSQTNGWFKRTIKIFKNARDRVFQEKPHLLGSFPSYFIECLVYNVPNGRFGGGDPSNYVDVVNWLNEALYQDNANELVCQNGMQYLFGSSVTQWDLSSARRLVSELIDLWNEW